MPSGTCGRRCLVEDGVGPACQVCDRAPKPRACIDLVVVRFLAATLRPTSAGPAQLEPRRRGRGARYIFPGAGATCTPLSWQRHGDDSAAYGKTPDTQVAAAAINGRLRPAHPRVCSRGTAGYLAPISQFPSPFPTQRHVELKSCRTTIARPDRSHGQSSTPFAGQGCGFRLLSSRFHFLGEAVCRGHEFWFLVPVRMGLGFERLAGLGGVGGGFDLVAGPGRGR